MSCHMVFKNLLGISRTTFLALSKRIKLSDPAADRETVCDRAWQLQFSGFYLTMKYLTTKYATFNILKYPRFNISLSVSVH